MAEASQAGPSPSTRRIPTYVTSFRCLGNSHLAIWSDSSSRSNDARGEALLPHHGAGSVCRVAPNRCSPSQPHLYGWHQLSSRPRVDLHLGSLRPDLPVAGLRQSTGRTALWLDFNARRRRVLVIDTDVTTIDNPAVLCERGAPGSP